ncbi:MAG: DUF2490 domain-containing protein [Methylobacter sp.]
MKKSRRIYSVGIRRWGRAAEPPVKCPASCTFGVRATLLGTSFSFGLTRQSPAGQSGFDHNRVFAGLGWSFNQSFRAEAEYLNQYVDDVIHTNNTMHDLIMGSLYINF